MGGAKQYQIFAALHEEANLPWVWLSSDCIESRAIVRIKRTNPNKSVSCQARIIDENFKTYYNRETRNHINDTDALVISDWYRGKLGGIKTGNKCSLGVQVDNWALGWFRLYRHHPDKVVRIAFCLGVVSVVLGILSLLVTLHPWRWFGGALRSGTPKAQSRLVLLPSTELAKLRVHCSVNSPRIEIPSSSIRCSLYNGSTFAVSELVVEVTVQGEKRLFRAPWLNAGTYEVAPFEIRTDEPVLPDMGAKVLDDPGFKALSPNDREAILNRLSSERPSLKPHSVSVTLARALGVPSTP